MNKLTALLFTLIASFAAAGCAEEPRSPYNSPDQQRAHADKAHSNLSSEINR